MPRRREADRSNIHRKTNCSPYLATGRFPCCRPTIQSIRCWTETTTQSTSNGGVRLSEVAIEDRPAVVCIPFLLSGQRQAVGSGPNASDATALAALLVGSRREANMTRLKP